MVNILICLVMTSTFVLTPIYGKNAMLTDMTNEQMVSENAITENTISDEITSITAEPILIQNEAEFLKFAEDVNNGNTYAGQQVELLADLNFHIMTDGIYVGIADSENNFQGTFNGNGHKIENLTINVPDGEAGLFVNLGGTVCNLKVVNGTVSGLISGGIASSVTDTGVIANCSNELTVTGDTAGGIAGISQGTIINCVAFATGGSTAMVGDNSSGVLSYCYNQINGSLSLYCNSCGDETLPEENRPMLQVLNDNLDRLHNLYLANNWEQWEMKENAPMLTENPASLLDTATISIMVSNKMHSLSGYFSESENAWCFAIPEGTEIQNRILELQFPSNVSDKMEVPMDTIDYAYEKEGIHYTFKFLTNDTVPSIFVDTNGEEADSLAYLKEDKKHELKGELSVVSEKGETIYTTVLESISGRGNDSWLAAKKGYNLKLKKAAELLSMGIDKDYVLIPGYRDNSLLSYKITQDMAKQMQIAYAPESRLVNAYIDGNYMGLYLLTEKMEIGTNRFNINDLYKETKKMNGNDLTGFTRETWSSDTTKANRVWYDIPNEPSDNTGGYLLELDAKDYDEKQSRFVSDNGTSITLKSNTYATKSQVDYVADLWQDFENAVSSENGYNEKGIYYADYIDMESFADQWLMYELNEDTSMTGSIYFYKDSDLTGDGRIHAGYTWDVEHSFIEEEHITKGWIMGRMKGELTESAPYWIKLYQHDDFAQLVYQEWKNKYVLALQILLDTNEVNNPESLSSITGYERAYTYAAAINSTRWAECNWWDKGEHVRMFLTARSEFLTKSLSTYLLGYDYYGEEDGVYYGYRYAANDGAEDSKEVIN